VVNKKSSKILPITLATLISLSTMLFSCKPGSDGQDNSESGDNDKPPITFNLGESIEVMTETLGAGGTISVDDKGDPLDGLTIDVPKNAYSTPTTFTLSYQPISDVKAKDDALVLSPLISIDNGGDYSDELIEVIMPVTMPDDYFAMAFYYDPETGDFEGIHTQNFEDGTIEFITRHFSKFTVFGLQQGKLDHLEIETDFKPGRDSWNLENIGSYVSPGGYCHGMTLTALYYKDWHWLSQPYRAPTEYLWKNDNDNGLGSGMETPDFWRDDKWAIQLCSVANSMKMTNEGLRLTLEYASQVESLMPDTKITFAAQEFYNIAFALWLSTSAQLVSVRSTSLDYAGHALICYGIDNNVLRIADPNYPDNAELKIVYDNSKAKFQNYSGGGYNFDIVIFSGSTTFYDWQKLDSLWEQFDRQDLGEYFPEYGILVTEYDSDGNEGESFEFRPTEGLTTSAKYLQFRIYAPFDSRANIYRFEDLDNSLSPDRVELDPGDNLLGIYVESLVEGLWWWAGFDWVNITFTDEEEPNTGIDVYECSHIESLRNNCRRGIYYTKCPDGTCWKCVDGEPVRVDCSD